MSKSSKPICSQAQQSTLASSATRQRGCVCPVNTDWIERAINAKRLHKYAAAPQRVSIAKLIDAQDLMMKTNPDMAPLAAVNQSLALLNDAEKRFTPRSSSMRQRLGKKRRRKLGLRPAPTDYSFKFLISR
uniref:Uncharacterized protein n=1 Tax=Ditylenchus dipsaci TaxID=166011 RepID=A0A915EHM8_9BILA